MQYKDPGPIPFNVVAIVETLIPYGTSVADKLRWAAVKDEATHQKAYWKFPGGRGEPVDNGKVLAGIRRELLQELQQNMQKATFECLFFEQRTDPEHLFYLFYTKIELDWRTQSHRGTEKERIKFWKPGELLRQRDFFPPHARVIAIPEVCKRLYTLNPEYRKMFLA